jgi:hypothetical protein
MVVINFTKLAGRFCASASLGYNICKWSEANTYIIKMGCAKGSTENPPPTKVY